MKYVLDGKRMVSREEAHAYLREAFGFPDYYGNNLDALHDCLTDISEETHIRLLNWKDAEQRLGNYARSAKRAILDAATENRNLAVIFE